ncbi:DUF423 domain-containing protein [Vreelandella massiliensis]|uniref:DUF423 domain-containing protein n=1 Tax=Vreelandella massiliensis TaxID=1816686 RepID=UPI00096AAC06|nr:DUF423 domain-containing protein [Halomonas massiliensis]MYL23545.1 DUF423 domain-containing protein [Halomonas alkaliantarctica]
MRRVNQWAWVGVALSGALTVALGAYAAHGLSARVSAQLVSAVETGVRYQAWHTLAMMALLVWQTPLKGLRWVITLWALGIVCFSGSLYLMALAGLNLGLVTPLGGVLLIVGWLGLGVVALLGDR